VTTRDIDDLDRAFGPDGDSMMVPGPHGSMVLRAGHVPEEIWRLQWGDQRRERSAAAMRAHDLGQHGRTVSAAEKRAAWEAEADRQRVITSEYGGAQ
jgi:hypothetical protein